MRRLILACGLVAAPSTALAQTTPDYFVTFVLSTSIAQQVAMACPTLSFELLVASRTSEEILQRLEGDGFDPNDLNRQMPDAGVRFAKGQAAFLAKHGLSEGDPEAAVCAAGQAELAEGSEIGRYLTEVAP